MAYDFETANLLAQQGNGKCNAAQGRIKGQPTDFYSAIFTDFQGDQEYGGSGSTDDKNYMLSWNEDDSRYRGFGNGSSLTLRRPANDISEFDLFKDQPSHSDIA